MAHSSDTEDVNSHSTSSPTESDAYSSPNQTVTAEGASETLGTPTDDRNVGMQPDNVVSSPRSLKAEASVETVNSDTSYDAQTHNDRVLPFPNRYWSITGRYPQSHGSDIGSRDNSFTVASEASTVVPIRPSSALPNYLGNNESGPPTSRFYSTNMQTPHQNSTGSTGTRIMSNLRFQPYASHGPRLIEHINVEVEPSTLGPPLAPYMGPPDTHSPGGTSETTADEINSTSAEEEEVPTIKRPRGTGEPRLWRIRYQQDIRRLCIWAQRWKALAKPPTHAKALGIALEAVKTIRAPIYSEHRLSKGNGMRTTEGKKASDAEQRRRKVTRDKIEDLSKYYQLATDQANWRCPELLSKILKDVENLSKPPVNPSV